MHAMFRAGYGHGAWYSRRIRGWVDEIYVQDVYTYGIGYVHALRCEKQKGVGFYSGSFSSLAGLVGKA